jgi:glycosyltransferase involved in cell wall biosynthesis
MRMLPSTWHYIRPRRSQLPAIGPRSRSGKEPGSMAPAPDGVQLSVIVPAYRTGPGIVESIRRLGCALDAAELDWEIVVVSDGDLDGYRDAAACRTDRIRVVGYRENRGKGFALRFGVTLARGELVTFLDADMQIAPEEIGRMVALLGLYDADVVVGSKRHPMSEVQYPWTRRLQSVVYQLLVRLLFRVKVRDTQTGLKVMRRQVAADVIDRAVGKRFAFDLELLTIARHLGYTRIIEAPVTIAEAFSSTTSPRAAAAVLQDTLAIFYRLRILRYYDQPAGRGLIDLHSHTPDLLHVE